MAEPETPREPARLTYVIDRLGRYDYRRSRIASGSGTREDPYVLEWIVGEVHIPEEHRG